jgi:hypothetical protein
MHRTFAARWRAEVAALLRRGSPWRTTLRRIEAVGGLAYTEGDDTASWAGGETA